MNNYNYQPYNSNIIEGFRELSDDALIALSDELELAAEDVERDYVSITPEAVVEDVKEKAEEATEE